MQNIVTSITDNAEINQLLQQITELDNRPIEEIIIDVLECYLKKLKSKKLHAIIEKNDK
jgi:hypothetical protein